MTFLLYKFKLNWQKFSYNKYNFFSRHLLNIAWKEKENANPILLIQTRAFINTSKLLFTNNYIDEKVIRSFSVEQRLG